MQVCEGKKKLLEWYDKASRRLKRSRTRVPSSLFNFIRILNAILEKHTRTRITSGRNDPVFQYVLELCRFAEPELNKKKGKGLSTVHETTKRVITEKHVKRLRDELRHIPSASLKLLKALRALFAWANEAEETSNNPAWA
jgi:hypothetical protein